MQPELRALEQQLRDLRDHPRLLGQIGSGGQVSFRKLSLEDISALLGEPVASLFLLAAANLNRTALRTGLDQPDAQLVATAQRRAFVVRSKLPPAADFTTIVELALQRRSSTLGRNENAATEDLFRDRLAFEGIPIRMRGAYTSGLLAERRKPDGVFPDPETGLAPRLYLEVKKINRVGDDIQKRLYEIAEVSLEVKYLYGRLELVGLNLPRLLDAADREEVRAGLRARITASKPVVVALVLCRFEELERARRYRPRAEAFIDRVFFADEIEECIAFLAEHAPPSA